MSGYRRSIWEHAMLALVVERPGLSGETLLAAIIEEANDALSRLKEHGLINPPDGDDS